MAEERAIVGRMFRHGLPAMFRSQSYGLRGRSSESAHYVVLLALPILRPVVATTQDGPFWSRVRMKGAR